MGQKKTKRPKRAPKAETYHHGDLKTTLIEAALKLLKTKSHETISLRELAREAGVSQAAPYRHFKDKKELISAIIEQGYELKYQFMEDAIKDSKGDPLKMYFGCGRAYFRMGLKHPQHFKLMANPEVIPSPEYPSLMTCACRSFLLVKRMLDYLQAKGVIGAGDTYHKAMHCWYVVNGFTTLYAEGRLTHMGVTAENAEAALETFLSQYLIGCSQPLSKSDRGFKPFQTELSSMLKEMVLDQPHPEVDDIFKAFKK